MERSTVQSCLAAPLILLITLWFVCSILRSGKDCEGTTPTGVILTRPNKSARGVRQRLARFTENDRELITSTETSLRSIGPTGQTPLLDQAKKAGGEAGDSTALTLPTEGGVFPSKGSRRSEPWDRRGPPTEACCWLILTRGEKTSGPNGP